MTIGTIATLVNGLSASSSEAGNRISAFQALYDPLLRANPDGSQRTRTPALGSVPVAVPSRTPERSST